MKSADIAHMNALRPANLTATDRLAGKERRKYTREPVLTAGVIHPVDQDDDTHRWSIFVHNVSCGGVGFQSQVRFDEGGVFFVRIGAGPLQLCGKVRIINCRPRPDGTCDVGAEFF